MTGDDDPLGARIRRLREARGLTQGELAILVGTTVKSIGHWESGKHRPRNKIGKLEEVFEVDLTSGLREWGSSDPVYRAVMSSELSKAGKHAVLETYERQRRAEGLEEAG